MEQADKRSYNGKRLPSGSSLGELFECKGRFLAEQNFEERETEEANLGTIAHEHMAEETDIDEVPDELNYLVYKAREQRALILEEFKKICPSVTKISREVRLWCKDGDEAYFSGEIDYFEVSENEEFAVIIDYKFFSGYYKPADQNRQLQTYSVLLKDEYPKLKTIFIALAQPMLDQWTTAIIDGDNLPALRARLVQLSREIQQEGAERKAGIHCKWCKALAHCPEAYEWVKKNTGEIEMDNVGNDELSEKMAMVPTLEQWFKAVKKLTKDRLEKGIDVPDYKLRKSGNITTFNVPEAAKKMFDANLSVDEFLKCCSLKEAELIKVWAKITAMPVAKAKKDLRLRLESAIKQKPKAQSVVKA